MKKIGTFLCLMTLTLSVFADFNENFEEFSDSQKIYISAENIQFSDKALFVYRNDAWEKIPAIYSDSNGLYISKQRSPETWYCIDCRTYHNVDDECPQAKKNR